MTTPTPNPTGGRQSPPASGDPRRNAPHLTDHGRDTARDAVDGLRQSAAGNVDRIADSFDAAASELEGGQVGQLSGYVHEMADKLSGFSRDLREKSGDDMVRQLNRFARDNPALFLTSSIAAGFALTRFARASRPDRHLPLPADEARVRFDTATARDTDRQASTATTSTTSTYTGGTNA